MMPTSHSRFQTTTPDPYDEDTPMSFTDVEGVTQIEVGREGAAPGVGFAAGLAPAIALRSPGSVTHFATAEQLTLEGVGDPTRELL